MLCEGSNQQIIPEDTVINWEGVRWSYLIQHVFCQTPNQSSPRTSWNHSYKPEVKWICNLKLREDNIVQKILEAKKETWFGFVNWKCILVSIRIPLERLNSRFHSIPQDIMRNSIVELENYCGDKRKNNCIRHASFYCSSLAFSSKSPLSRFSNCHFQLHWTKICPSGWKWLIEILFKLL